MSAIIGTSPRPLLPHCFAPAFAVLYPVPDVSQYQVPSPGRQITRSMMPSPSMSPMNGLSPRAELPHWFARPALNELPDVSEYQVPSLGRHSTRSDRPSPS